MKHYAHSAFDGFEDAANLAQVAAKEAIKAVVSQHMNNTGDVEAIYDFSWDGDFSATGATVSFNVTVYLTPLYEDEHPDGTE